uniref:Transcription cofactor vestigial-like protein 4 n=1 Tax=Anopheles atroparvus TaxID=41427 RepID=A0AAG5DLX4_ANOAO
MIRDPGGSSPNENLDSPPSPKYDRIGMLGRPPPLDDTEIPLDMTVRRKDSSDGQGSPTGGDPSRDVPINLNVRPSVITKAPPPPIKKRISHMHTNGEIVLKSSVRTSSSSAVDSKPIVHVSSTYCDVSIEEHFRRSLGPTYSSIYGDKQPLQQQQPSATALNVLNNNISTGHGSSFPSYDHQAKHPLPVPLLLQKHAMETCETPPIATTAVVPRGGTGTGGMRNHSSSSISSSSSVCSNSSSSSSSILGNSNNSNSSSSSSSSISNNNNNSTSNSNSSSTNSISIRSIPIAGMGGIRVVAPDTIELKLSSDPAPPIPLMPATVLPPSPGAPSPAAGLVTNVAISLTSPKHQAALLLQHPAPPISPASMTTTGSLASSSPSSSLASSPAPFLTLHPHQQQHAYQHQHQQQLKGNHDSGGEVDDHFAKALGDTWKKIQENKMNL